MRSAIDPLDVELAPSLVAANPARVWVRDRFGNVLGLTKTVLGWRDYLDSTWTNDGPGRWSTRFNSGIEAPSLDELTRLAVEALGPGARVEPRPSSGLLCEVVWPNGSRGGCTRFGALEMLNRIRGMVALCERRRSGCSGRPTRRAARTRSMASAAPATSPTA